MKTKKGVDGMIYNLVLFFGSFALIGLVFQFGMWLMSIVASFIGVTLPESVLDLDLQSGLILLIPLISVLWFAKKYIYPIYTNKR
jgi:hypothetical protein